MGKYAKLILILLITFLWLFVYGITEWQISFKGWALEKVDFQKFISWISKNSNNVIHFNDIQHDTNENTVVSQTDTLNQKILFFGDSMVEGLSRRLCDYAVENHHELYSVCWYSSTTQIWAESDTLNHFINTIHPSFIIVTIGGNEQFVRDLNKRKVYIRKIISKIGNIPFVWISTPSWTPDTEFNQLVCTEVSKKRYFDSTPLKLERGSDHIHPTFRAAEEWMDSVVVWMKETDVFPSKQLNIPTVKHDRKWHDIRLTSLVKTNK